MPSIAAARYGDLPPVQIDLQGRAALLQRIRIDDLPAWCDELRLEPTGRLDLAEHLWPPVVLYLPREEP